MSPRWSCDGVPSRKNGRTGEEARSLLAEPRDIDERFRSGKHSEQAQQRTS